MALDMVISTEISMPFGIATCSLSPCGGSPYLGAMLVGIVNLRPSNPASCFSSMIYSISTLTGSPGGMFPRLVLNTSGVCCSNSPADSFLLTASLYCVLASSFSFTTPSIRQAPTWHRKDTTAQDSYKGKVYLALAMGESTEGLMKVWERCVREAVS